MTKDSDNLLVALDAHFYTAEVGATEPDLTWDFDTDDLADIGWTELGWNTKDGIVLTYSRTTVNLEGQGSLDPLRVLVTAAPKSLALTLEEMTSDTFSFATGGATSTELAAGLYQIDPSDVSDLDIRAVAAQFEDGDKRLLVIYRKGTITGDTSIPFTDGQAALMPITYSVQNPGGGLKPFTAFANFDAMAPVGS